jgi:hypothetical protein
MLPRFDSPIHADHFNFLGIPVFESRYVNRPILLEVPIPATGQTRLKIIVPNLREFENEMWIESTLHRVVSEQMGDTLEWLHGTRTWVSPSSRFSILLMRVQIRQFKTDPAMQQQLRHVASTIRSVSPEAGGPWIPRPGFGFMPTQRAVNPNT